MTRLILIALLLAGLARADMGRRTLDVRERVVCRGGVLRLGDLVTNEELLGPDERDLSLRDGVPPGRYLSLVSLAYLLQRHETLRDVRLRGPQWITLQHIASPERLARARTAIRDVLTGRPPWKAWTIDVVFSDNDNRLLGSIPEFATLQVQPVDAREVLGHVGLRVSFRDAEDTIVHEVSIAPEISRQVQVCVVARRLERGTVIAAEDLQTATIWAGVAHRELITDRAMAVGKEVVRDLDAGALLKAPLLEERVCARRGDDVWVTCDVGALSVRLPARAMETGREGDRIKVMNPRSRKVFEAELVGDRLVTVAAATR